jgi:hypothetical protein
MRVLPSAGSSGSAEPVLESAPRVRTTDAAERSLGERWLFPSGAAFAGKRP